MPKPIVLRIPGTAKHRVHKLESQAELLKKDQAEIMPAFEALSHTAGEIEETLKDLETRSTVKYEKMIDGLNISDSKYKEELKKALHLSVDKGIKELTPLKEDTNRLLGQMIVANNEAAIQYGIVISKVKVYQAGKVQLDFLKKLHQENDAVGRKIKDLLRDAERVNKLAPIVIEGQRSIEGSIKSLIPKDEVGRDVRN
jgi:sugar-specific transcriptional regulator TrmB